MCRIRDMIGETQDNLTVSLMGNEFSNTVIEITANVISIILM